MDAGRELLSLRADLMARVRAFFSERQVMEVDVPVLSRAAGPDPAIAHMLTRYRGSGHADGLTLYLGTSPEFFMKRLLAGGSGPVYQLSHVFRDGESGRCHNPEFSLLEWYRPGFSPAALMDETEALLRDVLDGYFDYQPARRLAYRDWFLHYTGLDPWQDSVDAFRAFARQTLGPVPGDMPDDLLEPWLDLIVSHYIEPRMEGQSQFIFDYPPAQAALARIRDDDYPVAERFELYVGGLELANGFHELADSAEQRRRFEHENDVRGRSGLPQAPLDEHLLEALDDLPDCSGIALGFDRLVMLAAGAGDIADVLPFSLEEV